MDQVESGQVGWHVTRAKSTLSLRAATVAATKRAAGLLISSSSQLSGVCLLLRLGGLIGLGGDGGLSRLALDTRPNERWLGE